MNQKEEQAIAAVTELGYRYWGNTKDCDDYRDAIECDAFWPSFPEETPVYHAESFVCIAIGDEVYLKDFGSFRDRDTREAEVKKLQLALWATTIEWIREHRDDIESDEFVTTYKGCNIYLCVPNGGILAAGFVVPEESRAYSFESESLEIDLYIEEQWHINCCKAKIDQLFAHKPKQMAIGRCPMPALTAGMNND